MITNNKKLKIALVHDFLVQRGGAERVLEVLAEIFPEAPIYTLLHDEEKMRGLFKGKDVRTSYLQKFPKFLRKRYQWLIPFFPVIPETLDLREFDLVISSSGAWMKGIVTKMSTTHIAYLHSPMRFVWDYNDKYLKETKNKKMSFLARVFFNYLRIWDKLASERPDFLVANSKYTQQRIKKYYRRESVVIYPPVTSLQLTTDNSQQKSEKIESRKLEVENYFLVVSRLSPYKKVEVAVDAFNKLGLPLLVIGEGEQAKHLKAIAKENIKFLDWQKDEVIREYYANALGFIFLADDDFGIAPVEAMLAGVPVLAYRKGGVLETVEEGVTGEFFDAQTPEVLADGVRRFMLNRENYDKDKIRAKGAEFSKERFKSELALLIKEALRK